MATGLHITELPLDPEHIWRLLKEKRQREAESELTIAGSLEPSQS
jgi:hypothetical protein